VRSALLVLAGLLGLTGLVWLLQGLNLLAGSPMTGDPFWAVMGALAILVGVALAALTRRAGRGRS
jgi:hypothetical protein